MVLDYSSNLHYFWALLPEFILCGWGMFILILGVSGKRDPRKGGDLAAEGPSQDLGLLTLVGVLAAALANGWLYGVTEAGQGLVTVDRFRLFANWTRRSISPIEKSLRITIPSPWHSRPAYESLRSEGRRHQAAWADSAQSRRYSSQRWR